jgi:arsenate reductase (thioredoxin)
MTPEVLFVCVHNAGRSQMAADVVITMGCGDACPIYPGKRYLIWDLTEPAGKPLEDIRPIRDDTDARVHRLLTELVPHPT